MANTLLSVLPNPKDLLALAPEELAGILLELIPSVGQRDGMFTMGSLISPLFPSTGDGYSLNVQRPVNLAVAEAMSWLRNQGLVIDDPGQSSDWLIVTRRGKSLRTRADVTAFRKGRILVAAERDAEMHLFAGAIGHAKNPTSHRDVTLAPEEAARLVVFAGHLLSIVEQRLP